MSKSVTTRQEAVGTVDRRTGYRPTYFLLGIDTEGSHHVCDLKTESVHVITPAGDREHRQQLHGHPIEAYMDVIDGGRGWADVYYGGGINGLVARAMEDA